MCAARQKAFKVQSLISCNYVVWKNLCLICPSRLFVTEKTRFILWPIHSITGILNSLKNTVYLLLNRLCLYTFLSYQTAIQHQKDQLAIMGNRLQIQRFQQSVFKPSVWPLFVANAEATDACTVGYLSIPCWIFFESFWSLSVVLIYSLCIMI